MPNHFSAIGIQINSDKSFDAVFNMAARESTEIPARGGRYLRWSETGVDHSIQLWIQLDFDGQLVGATPYFEGKSSFTAGITSEVHRADNTEMEGAVHAWANPTGGLPEKGEYPFVFDLVDFGCHSKLAYPFVSEIKLSAFAHELKVYDSLAEFEALNTKEPRFASESFIPTGLFNIGGDGPKEPQSHAIFTGRVIETATLKSSLTGGQFQWALIKTLGGMIDVVCELELAGKPIKEGGILSGSFWLCGRILMPKTADAGYFKGIWNRMRKR